MCVIWKDFFNSLASVWLSFNCKKEGRRRNREIEKWEEAVLGSMMEDTKEETGREWEWREDRSIVGGIWRAQWRGMR